MRSIQNLLIVLTLLVFTISCGLTDETEGDVQDSAVNSESTKETFDDGDLVGEGEGEDPEPEEAAAENKVLSVRFGKGKTSRTYRDTVSDSTKHTYSFGVAEGQRITVKITSDDGSAYFEGYDPIGNRLSARGDRETDFSEVVPESGNYKIEVVTPSDSSYYTVTFSASALPKEEVVDEGPGGLTKNVRFAKGRSAATYRDAVIRGEQNTYILGAQAGQLMSVNISSVENNAVFQIRGPGGYLRGAEPGTDQTSWSGQLPANGKYRVIVGGTRGNATYSITFAIR